MLGRGRRTAAEPIDPDLLLRAYSVGVFPMADSRDATDIFWVEPKKRGVLPLDGFHLSHSLRKTLRSDRFAVTADRAFARVMQSCAEATADRPETWINGQIEQAYTILHRNGHAHSIEVWRSGDIGGDLVGGLYGVSLGGAYFGESMFSRMADTSKIALAHLVARLRFGGYKLLDCQFITDHLASLGAIEIGRTDYRALLDAALGAGVAAAAGGAPASSSASADFFAAERAFPPATEEAMTVSGPISGCVIAQLLGHTS
ncbi:leucyl/phenylalanyl-tRNA--protein transferase [Sphingomonas oryzagri]|jgi:leucyl/phenylalanyl-tRNA--protein transferase|uniref:Leucyl/phenylalanyl-tRNA--protein transferase n=1 Tax=Sphingomonas oryzagri TaxID=3042314 RepID=A0ABT6N0P2_9SPHN|nr:leucyl/phenylalanyl-tRNA--protein transferase [Sphingomonas oryzagri]MDH7638873.1 leucyl/phenylalanyl-tRNA--protein transferase [Sphingomonas oryzagri]